MKSSFRQFVNWFILATLLFGSGCGRTPTPTAAPDSLELPANIESVEEYPVEELDGSGPVAEEPPGYFGKWWGQSDGEFDEHEFHTGDLVDSIADQIVKLEISSMNGGEMPEVIGKCRNLRELWIDYGNEKPLPAGIWSLWNMEKLRLDFWFPANISPRIGQLKRLKSLEILGVIDKDSIRIPPEIGNLTQLERLSLHSDVMLPLPKEIFRLKKLSYLLLQDLDLTELPKQIGNLVELDTLILSNNRLQDLPGEMVALQRLELLDLSYNLFDTVPRVLQQMKWIKSRDFTGNPPEK